MRRLLVFNSVTLDGYFTGVTGDMSWAHRGRDDEEWNKFIAANASGKAVLVFGRITYDLMAGYWPTKTAMAMDPVVAAGMNDSAKIVFSRTMDRAAWKNTILIRGDPVAEMRKMKKASGDDMVILGSGSIVSQLAQEGLIDEYQIVVNPVVLGTGRTMFNGVKRKLTLKLTNTRTFDNGCVYLRYGEVERRHG